MKVNFNHTNGMFWALLVLILGIFSPFNAYAASTAAMTLDLTQHWVGYASRQSAFVGLILVDKA